VVVTGAAGFIGSHLVEALLAGGSRVIGIDAFTPYYAPSIKRANVAAASRDPSFELLPADLNELDLDEVLQPGDTVYHLAGQPGVRQSWGDGFQDYTRHNIDATQRLLEAARRRDVSRVIFASSSSVYGDAPLPMAEDGPLRPVSPYGVSKRTAEDLCLVYWRTFGLPVVPLRFFTVYGPRQRPDMAFNLFVRAVAEGRPVSIYGSGNQLRDFTYVADVIAVLLAAAESADPGVPINVGGGGAVSVREALAIIEQLVGRPAKVEFRPLPPGDARDTQASTERVRGLHVPSVPLSEGLEHQVAWQLEAMRRVRRLPAVPARYAAPAVANSGGGSVLIYSHDSYGLGHLRRNTAIAHALLKRDPRLRVVLLSGSSVAGDWPLPAGIEVVRLPVAVKVGADSYEPAERRSMSGLRAERAGIISSTLLRLRPDVFLVDHTPLGMKGELTLALQMAREELHHTRVIIGLRDVVDDAATVRRAWREQGIYQALEDSYDQVLVYGSREIYDITRQYAFSPSLAERTTFTGYIGKDRGLEPRVESAADWSRARRGEDPRILVTGGGGGDAGDLFRVFLKAWSRLAGRVHGQVLMVMGPLMEPAVAASIERRAARLPGVQVLRSSKSVLSLIAGADVVVAMGGYNTVVEGLAARKPLVLCPRVTPRREQLIRARLMAGLGLARVVQIERESSKALALAVEEALTAARPPAAAWRAVDLGGADRVAEIVLSAVGARQLEPVRT
jgi:predicted glycosyltransferase/nucleoside-diphosphate-sugar epimerase